MKYNLWEARVRNYIRTGSELIKNENINFEIKRNQRKNYLGISTLSKCARLLWVQLYHPKLLETKKFDSDDNRKSRIFDLGHLIEDITIKILIAGGANVNSSQFQFSDFNNFLRGHVDCILDNQCVVEIKSMNQDSFTRFITNNLKQSHFDYYVQIQMYMHYSKLTDAVIIATNKNTCEIECQYIAYDKHTIDFHLKKAETIINNTNFFQLTNPFISDSLYECSFCLLNKMCFKQSKK